jgi:hypothetical protein
MRDNYVRRGKDLEGVSVGLLQDIFDDPKNTSVSAADTPNDVCIYILTHFMVVTDREVLD